jgi:hypothetical protein
VTIDPIDPSPASTTDVIAEDQAPSSSETSTQAEPDATTPPAETAPAGLTEVHIIGMKYVDYFTDGTNTYTFPGDPEIHAHIAEKDAPIPTHEGLTWVHSTGNYLYDTASGDLEEGQYAVQPNGSYIEKKTTFCKLHLNTLQHTLGSPSDRQLSIKRCLGLYQ